MKKLLKENEELQKDIAEVITIREGRHLITRLVCCRKTAKLGF